MLSQSSNIFPFPSQSTDAPRSVAITTVDERTEVSHTSKVSLWIISIQKLSVRTPCEDPNMAANLGELFKPRFIMAICRNVLDSYLYRLRRLKTLVESEREWCFNLGSHLWKGLSTEPRCKIAGVFSRTQ